MQNFLNARNLTVVQKSLDALWTKQKVINSNIANLDTPGYKSKSVAFEDILNDTLKTSFTNNESFENKLNAIKPQIIENTQTSMRDDGNNVDIDEQNIELTRVMIQYEFMSRSISSDISRLKYAINEGRG